MQRLFLFFFKYRAFLIFLFLEGVCLFLIVKYNTYQQAVYLNSSSTVAGGLLGVKSSVNNYLDLDERNIALQEENRRLRELLFINSKTELIEDSLVLVSADSSKQFEVQKTEVINSTVNLLTNYITIRGGKNIGLKKGDALINDLGVVGKVTYVSNNFATAISLLHAGNHISTEIKRTKTICSTKWDGRNPGKSKVLYVPRHVEVLRGDTIVTSGYNAIFPPGLNVGIIDEVTLSPDASFYEIKIDLFVDFYNLDFVYSIQNLLKSEQDSLETVTKEEIER